MQSPIEIRHAHFQQLYLAERARRESIRSSISTPVAAISFAVFALSTLATEFDVNRWAQPVSLAIIVLACGGVAALLGAAYNVVMAEWLFTYHEPPGLADLLDAEDRIRAGSDKGAGGGRTAESLAPLLMDLLTASYSVSYQQYLCGNAGSARSRTWALRLVLASLMQLALAFILLPLHLHQAG